MPSSTRHFLATYWTVYFFCITQWPEYSRNRVEPRAGWLCVQLIFTTDQIRNSFKQKKPCTICSFSAPLYNYIIKTPVPAHPKTHSCEHFHVYDQAQLQYRFIIYLFELSLNLIRLVILNRINRHFQTRLTILPLIPAIFPKFYSRVIPR